MSAQEQVQALDVLTVENGWACVDGLSVIKRKERNQDNVRVSDLAAMWRVARFTAMGSACGGTDGGPVMAGRDTFCLEHKRWRCLWKSRGLPRESTV